MEKNKGLRTLNRMLKAGVITLEDYEAIKVEFLGIKPEESSEQSPNTSIEDRDRNMEGEEGKVE